MLKIVLPKKALGPLDIVQNGKKSHIHRGKKIKFPTIKKIFTFK